MARIRRSADLGTIEARRRLRAFPEPYWLLIERGLSIGYRKSAEGGAWVSRVYNPQRRRHVEARLGTADDNRSADGTDVLSFGQAQRKLLAETREGALRASGQLYSISDAVTDYITWQKTHRKAARDSELRLKAYLLKRFEGRLLSDLTAADFDAWLTWAMDYRPKERRVDKAATPPPKKPRKNAKTPKPKVAIDPAELKRRRRSTLNRIINLVKACLNHAFKNGRVNSDIAWRRLHKFRSADSARLRWLTIDEARRLQNACAPDFRGLVSAGLSTGCSASELLAMHAGDVDSRSKTVLVADSKSGKPRRVPLTDEGVKLFESLIAGKRENEAIFSRAAGSRWHRMAMLRAMNKACTAAKIRPAATFHVLRHSYASHLVQQGVPLMFVASALGHHDTRMVEKHYAHFAQSAVADMIRAKLPNFSALPESNVSALRGR
jgi:integrase